MKENTKRLILSIALPILVGTISGLLTMGAMRDFQS